MPSPRVAPPGPAAGQPPAPTPPLDGGRPLVELRRWRVSDAADLDAAVRASVDLDRQLPTDALSGPAGCARVTAELATWGPRDHHLALVQDGQVVGSVAVTGAEHRHGTGWVSYWLSAPARGQGLASRAVATAADLAFRHLDLHRLELGHRLDNPASCRVAARAGFRAEGVEREKLRYGDLRFDVETHARLATDALPEVALLTVR